MKSRSRQNWILWISAVCAFLPAAAQSNQDKVYKKLDVLAKVLSYVEANYIHDTDNERLMDDAIKGLLSSLDPHTAYMPPDVFKEMKVDTRGEFAGLGLEVSLKDEILTVVTAIEDTPADEAGLKPGDQILKIDGVSTKGMSLLEAVRKMRGRRGTSVKLLIQRPPETETKDISVVREIIRIQSVSHELLDHNYAYIRVKSFQEKTDLEMKKAFKKMDQESRGNIKGVLLDLRNNPGGLLDQAVRVADFFLDKGAIVSTRGKKGAFQEVEMAHSEGTRPYTPMITLVNEGSASASEIVAGALQDHGRSVILGRPTFGKGSVQTIIDLDDGSGLKLTIAHYYTPKGRSIQVEGIQPDIDVSSAPPKEEEQVQYLREKDLKGHMDHPEDLDAKPETKITPTPKKSGVAATLDTDAQLRRALEYIKTWEVFRTAVVPKASGT